MTDSIYDAVEKVRNIFNIKEFPGDFFSILNSYDYIEEFGLFLFKEDIGKLSGFMGYGPENMTAICVNYKRSYGHQNFTLAHEIGHWFLHKGKSMADADKDLSNYRSALEREANRFAGELLYPEKCIDRDFKYALEKNLFDEKCRAELGRFIMLDNTCYI